MEYPDYCYCSSNGECRHCLALLETLEKEKEMKTQNSPTYIGHNKEMGAWAFSPSLIEGVDKQWDASDWTWDDVKNFMTFVAENAKEEYLDWHAVKVVK